VTLHTFKLPWENTLLCGDSYQAGCNTIVLHGAGKSSRSRFSRLRDTLHQRGIPTAAFDFIGHGETGGELLGSTLCERTEQAAAVIRYACREPLTLIAASMSGHTAIKLTEIFDVENLVLLVPAVYTSRAYHLPFGPEFSAAIRVPESWRESDAFDVLAEFKGKLLIVAAECDGAIPAEVPQRMYSAAGTAADRMLHVIPDAGHTSLFLRDQDFHCMVDMIAGLCRRGWQSADADHGTAGECNFQ
jgi:pimeloyl-ACP methyl ester carboxylesterase